MKVQLEVQKTELDTVKAQLNLKLTLLQGEVRKLEKQLGSQDLDSVTLLATTVGLSPLPINSPLFTRLMPSVTQRAPAVSIRDEIKALKEAIKSLREDLARPSGDAEATFSELPLAFSTPVR
ncbi:MAG: hypothetical protein GWP59_07355 [Chlamydiales bacterium]|nr:hypothetical protein [Chlamydiales bacterium]